MLFFSSRYGTCGTGLKEKKQKFKADNKYMPEDVLDMGRPRKNIDVKLVEELAGLNCSIAEISRVVGCSETTLKRSFGLVIKRARESVKTSLKRKQYEVAMKGNPALLIWLGKIILKQKEKTKIDGDIEIKIIRTIKEATNGN